VGKIAARGASSP